MRELFVKSARASLLLVSAAGLCRPGWRSVSASHSHPRQISSPDLGLNYFLKSHDDGTQKIFPPQAFLYLAMRSVSQMRAYYNVIV